MANRDEGGEGNKDEGINTSDSLILYDCWLHVEIPRGTCTGLRVRQLSSREVSSGSFGRSLTASGLKQKCPD